MQQPDITPHVKALIGDLALQIATLQATLAAREAYIRELEERAGAPSNLRSFVPAADAGA